MRRVLGSVSREQQVVRSGVVATARSVRSYTTAAAASATVSGRKWDAIVVGGGHNGLVTAAYLAKVPSHSIHFI
jgi:ribulose 1,5-bisphosphate synthetase/thiazole synthase